MLLLINLFFIISFSELLQAWGVLKQFNEKWTAVIFFTLTEFIPSVLIAHYLSINGGEGRKEWRRRRKNIQTGQSLQRFESNHSESGQSFGDEENQRAYLNGETSSSEDSYGSFNPNYKRQDKNEKVNKINSFDKNINNFSSESKESQNKQILI